MERLCEHCGQPFVPKRIDAAYCGHSCRQQAYLLRKFGLGNNSAEGKSDYSEIQNEMTDNQEPLLSITNDEPQPSPRIEKCIEVTESKLLTDKKGTEYSSSFLDYIDQRINFRDYSSFLYAFEIHYPALSYWVNTRYLCLIESLLKLSETKSVDVDDLKDISNAFHLLLHSETFENMPPAYPYKNEMNKYFETIKQFCFNSEEEMVVLRFTRRTKAELLATRFELAQLVAKVGFDQLNFSE